MYNISTFATLSNVLKFVVVSLVKGVHIGYVFLYKEKKYLSIIVNVYNYSVKRKQRWLDDLSVCLFQNSLNCSNRCFSAMCSWKMKLSSCLTCKRYWVLDMLYLKKSIRLKS